MAQLGKTTDERLHYNTPWAKRRYADHLASDTEFWNSAAALGEVVKVEFQKPTGLKEEIHELADRTRAANGLRARSGSSAVGPEYDRLDELIIEAHERGWSGGEIGRALRCSTSSAASRVRYALAKRAEAVAA